MAEVEMIDERPVERLATATYRMRDADLAERDNSDLGGPCPAVHDHSAARLIHWQTDAYSRKQGLIQKLRLREAGIYGGR